MYSYLRATVPGEHCRMHVGFCGFESGNRHLAIRFKKVRGFHVLVAQVAYGQHVFDAVRPWGEYVIGVVRVSARMKALPLGPETIHVAVMSPEDWIARGRARRDHVAVLRLVREFSEVRIRAARKIVDEVMYVFDRAEKVVTFGAAAKGEEALDL